MGSHSLRARVCQSAIRHQFIMPFEVRQKREASGQTFGDPYDLTRAPEGAAMAHGMPD